MDKQLYILGAGRHPRTKAIRALRGHQRRTFYIGEIHVQSGKRLPVSVEWARRHFDAIVKHINDGTVLMHFAADKFVDPEELRTLCFGTEEEIAAYTEEATSTGDDEDLDEPPQAEEVSSPVVGSVEPTVPQEPPALGPSAEDLARVAERSDEPSLELAGEPSVEPTKEPEVPLAEETAPVTEPEASVAPEQSEDAPLAPETAEEPAMAAEATPEPQAAPETPPPAPEPESEPTQPAPQAGEPLKLPEDWKKKSKATLLGYASSLGLDTSSMPSNKQLITMIEDATKKEA